MARLTKKRIVTYLKDKGVYDAVDDLLIDELLYSMELCDMAKADIKENGVTITRNGIEGVANPAVTTYLNASKQIINISNKLNLDPRARVQMKLNVNEESDGFDD
jgi:P27 family predicted phage terminase small subunit